MASVRLENLGAVNWALKENPPLFKPAVVGDDDARDANLSYFFHGLYLVARQRVTVGCAIMRALNQSDPAQEGIIPAPMSCRHQVSPKR